MDAPIRQAPPVRLLPLALTDSTIRSEQLLAVAVFARALDDARDPRDPERQHAARIFLLRDTAIFPFWCAVLGVDPVAVRALARQALATAPTMVRQDARPAA